jgi:hypothetical protein
LCRRFRPPEWVAIQERRDSIPLKLDNFSWLPPRDSNPDMLLQRQLSYH